MQPLLKNREGVAPLDVHEGRGAGIIPTVRTASEFGKPRIALNPNAAVPPIRTQMLTDSATTVPTNSRGRARIIVSSRSWLGRVTTFIVTGQRLCHTHEIRRA